MKTPILIASIALSATSAAGCISSAPGVVRADANNPIVTIGAGEASISGGGDAWRVWYVIDRSTQTCWMKLGDSGAELDCCKLHRIAEARPYLFWIGEGDCSASARSGS